jgi:hypothetical protein
MFNAVTTSNISTQLNNLDSGSESEPELCSRYIWRVRGPNPGNGEKSSSSPRVQIDSGAHPVSYLMGAG